MKALIGILIMTAVVGCGQSDRGAATPPQDTLVACISSVTVSPPNVTLHVGDTARLRAAACNIAPTQWRWRMSDPALASIDSTSGLLRAERLGTVTAIAALVTNPAVKGAAAVVVVAP